MYGEHKSLPIPRRSKHSGVQVGTQPQKSEDWKRLYAKWKRNVQKKCLKTRNVLGSNNRAKISCLPTFTSRRSGCSLSTFLSFESRLNLAIKNLIANTRNSYLKF